MYFVMNNKLKELELLRQLRISKSRKSFWEFCKTINPKFFKESRSHLKQICNTFQALYEGRIIKYNSEDKWQIVDSLEGLQEHITCKKLQLNLPPGFGKSYTSTLFSQWAFGKDIDNEIITVSYNEKLSSKFGQIVRDGIEQKRSSPTEIIYQDIFPRIKVKYGDASKSDWSLEGRYHSYLATSFKATITGMRGNIGIIDDPVRDSETAFNDEALNNQYEWYCDTFLSRMVEGAIQIIIGTRWRTIDLCGRVLKDEPHEWYVLKLQAYDEKTDTMLCPDLMSKQTYLSKKKLTSPEIFLANYQQICVDLSGALYKNLKTYTDIPKDEKGNTVWEQIINYTDTADSGNDSLCSICAGIYNGDVYLLDVLYTKDGMEVTEPATAKMLINNNVNYCKIESNNGGKGFSRNVIRLMKQLYRSNSVTVKWFHQSKNKISRILTNSTFVMEHIYFPVNWSDRWPEFYQAVTTFQKVSKNKNDDAPDTLTGIAEMIDTKKKAKAVKSLY